MHYSFYGSILTITLTITCWLVTICITWRLTIVERRLELLTASHDICQMQEYPVVASYWLAVNWLHIPHTSQICEIIPFTKKIILLLKLALPRMESLVVSLFDSVAKMQPHLVCLNKMFFFACYYQCLLLL